MSATRPGATDTGRTGPSPLRPVLVLYPRAWRDRYGAEFAEMLDAERLSISLVIDVLFGAVDAHVRPQAILEQGARAGAPDEGETMTTNSGALSLGCGAYGRNVTRRDQWMGVAVMLGVTVVLAILYVWLHVRFGDNPYVDAFSIMPFMAGLILSLPFTYLKGRPKISQAVFLGMSLLFLTAIFAIAGAISARL